MVDSEDRLPAERALAGTPARSVVAMDKKGVRGLKDALTEAALKFVPDRTVLPIPDKAFGGTQGRTLDESPGDWSMLAGASAPDGAPNVLLIVIDDAGYGNAGTFGGPIATPTMTRVRDMGLTYNRFHVTALCSPTRASLLTGRNPHRVGFGTLCEFLGPFPGYTTVRPRSCAALPRILKENGYVTGGFGKWHITPSRELGAAGPFDHWPTRLGLRALLGLPPGRLGPVRPRSSCRTTRSSAYRKARPAGRTTSPTTSPTGRSSGYTRCAPTTGTSRGSSTTRPGAATRHTRSLRSGWTSTGGASTRAGTYSERRSSRGRRNWASCPPTRSSARARTPSLHGRR